MNKKLKVAFFTEAGTKRGLGHLIRSYAIYDEFKSRGFKVSFFLDSDIDLTYKFKDINSFKWSEFTLYDTYDIIFIDSYEAKLDIYEAISSSCNIAVYIDDYRRLEYPNGVIINFGPDSENIFFQKKDNKHKYLLGLKYIPIRDDFLNIKIEKKSQIFIMLGGSDIANLSLELANIFKDTTIKKIIVSNKKSVVNSLKKYNNVEILYKPSDTELVQAMANSSVAISTASMSVYELAYLRIPTIIIAVSQNQIAGVKQFLKNGLAASYININNSDWYENIKNETMKLLNEKQKPKKTIDEYGIKRICEEVLSL